MKIHIREEATADVGAIGIVTTAAFLEAPHSSHTEQFIVAALRAAGVLSISLVAELDGVLVGHVAVSPVTIADGTPNWFGLGPLSVMPSRQRLGIGSRLMKEALSALRQRGAAGCVLLGDPQYYRRFGFEPQPGLVLPDVPPAYFQALSFGSTMPRGVVSYHTSFDATG